MDEKAIYQKHADLYDMLVSREDHQSNLLPALEQIVQLDGRVVLELGAGTGRLTRLLAPAVRSILSMDASLPMLRVARTRLKSGDRLNYQLAVGDHRRLPVGEGMVDLIISGWSICYLVTWGEQDWRDNLYAVLTQIRRALRPGGAVIILETLGTGVVTPRPPDHLVGYYAFLEASGFRSTWIRTDYQFENFEEAERLVKFFFGEELARDVLANQWVILPECTGLWWLKV